ncbi:MAG: transcription-repair coupling factor [candidate division Zixibacteria bacterium CG_4_9_14_3_um_filter_46_8]|nr:MAG: transcription-repair coupling factor [candidate division Zixibacteria bacterium CG_4_9_14_3_um_filter_46_8]
MKPTPSSGQWDFAIGQFMLDHIRSRITKTNAVTALLTALGEAQNKTVNVSGIEGSFFSVLIGALYYELHRPILIVVPDEDDAGPLQSDLKNFIAPANVFHLNWRGIYPFQMKTTYFETTGSKLESLYALLNDSPIVVASVASLAERTIPPTDLIGASMQITKGEERDMAAIALHLSDSGYRRSRMVEEVGDFAVRGGIIDIFPASSDYPVRIEFFGDEVDSIREFSVANQRSLQDIDKVLLFPRREFQMPDNDLKHLLQKFPPAQEEALHQGLLVDDPLPGLEWLAPLSGSTSAAVVDYLPDNAIIVLLESELIEGKFNEFETLSISHRESAESEGWPVCELEKLLDSFDKFSKDIERFSKILPFPFKIAGKKFLDFGSYRPTIISLKPEAIRNKIDEFLGDGAAVFVACDNVGQKDRVEELLGEDRPELTFGVSRLEQGFVYPDGNLAVLTDHELFGHHIRRRPRRFKEGISLPDYRSLNANDYVVHIDFGIGQYNGLQTITVEGRRRDCLCIDYKDDDRIYVPIEQFNRVQKYSGSESRPQLSKLGGTAWKKAVNRAKKAVMEMAEELIAIYARRKVSPGFAFPPDTDWQKQIEASFPYEETQDQISAMAEIKADMESSASMDRLICGDVGYGKTELAVRAAFKAIDAGKQVALIAPTTVLAQQHFDTFKERMAEFPIKIQMLSRFVDRARQKKILQEISAKNADMIIGTHRLLGKDVEFADIGLLIIDEEQRFGVAHKEKLKRWRTVIDILTLTATPIPRTMQLSLMGARDMSIINTPPKDRRPIITEVSPFSDKIILEAVLREVDRGGQIFFVHNRVQSIEAIHRYLQKLLPSVSFGIAHGQMNERQLEKIMHQFSKAEFQCLISTTIIESGLDIPAVNTIIIHRADQLGLAQLYQLRGRVGRSDRQAFAYFLIPPFRLLSDTAKRRLKAMEEFTALGSGFHLALRDLEIRGAGNLLGSKQHGFIEEIGFDLYCRLLDEAVAELKGEEISEEVDTKLALDCDLYVPEGYIPDKDLRVDLYRRLADAIDYGNVDSIFEETADRFGKPPETVANLFEMSKIRIAARKLGLSRVSLKGEKILAEFSSGKQITRNMVAGLVKAVSQRIEFYSTENFQMDISLDGLRGKNGLSAVTEIIRNMAASLAPQKAESVL